jgi:sulfur-oxidizing protein SoxY
MYRVTITRRDVLKAGAVGAFGAALPTQANAVGQMETAIRNVIGEAEIRKGRVLLDLPPLVENGNTVPMTVSVDSPMTRTTTSGRSTSSTRRTRRRT